MKKIIIASLLFSFFIASCGGGGDGNGGSTKENINTPDNKKLQLPNELLLGGSLLNPTYLNSTRKYKISTNNFYNYFYFNGNPESIIFLKAEYELPFTLQNKQRCGRGLGTIYDIYNENNVKDENYYCDDHLKYHFITNSRKIFHLPSDIRGNGTLFFSSVTGNSAIKQPSGESGTMSNPRQIGFRNTIKNNSFYNFFKYSAKANETINISGLCCTKI
ncbi:hypothetical protein [Acinetobacter sp. HR7]|uniref:hypothetical protein n=1 Tax=Acinetobacter sp. HR7 TaxID=1509403 RepID=UPI000537A8B5|nr:hypothetical protein [Acinetobacter sp. HR7]KGT46063.1 hypothetical protein GW12_28540 [Acinetobacter sp. HR7]